MSQSPHLFPYPGAKRRLQEHIVPKLNEQLQDSSITTYAEPFFGAGGIGLAFLGNEPPIEKVIINDRDCGVASTWTCVIRYPEELCERVESFQPTVEAYHRLNDFLMRRKTVPGNDVVELGFANLALHRISFRGKGTRAGSPQGGGQLGKSDIANIWNPERIVSLIREYHELFKAFDIDGNCCHSFDWQRVLDTGEPMLAYLDPPHYQTGENFYHIAFTNDDHIKLSEYLCHAHHKWILSYDDSQILRRLYEWADIQTITVNYRGFDPRDINEILITPKQVTVSAPKPKNGRISNPPSLFQHPGNKGKLKAHILPRLQEQLEYDTSLQTYCEPFLGSASLCLSFLATNPPIQKLVLNDRDIGVASLWTSVIRHPDDLIQRAYEFQPTVAAFHRLKDFLSVRKVSGGHESMIDIGFANLAIHQISYGGRGTMAAGALGGWAQLAQEKVDSRWKPERLEEKIRQCHQILTPYEIEDNSCTAFDFQKVLESSPERMLAYIDPPYYADGKHLYHLNFDVDDHHRLAEYLRNTEHAWVLSYDNHPVIHKLYDWAAVSPLTVDYRSRRPKKSQEILIYPKQGMATIPKPKSRKKNSRQNEEASPVIFKQSQPLRLDDITLDEQLFSRADGLRQDVIDEYREAVQRGDTFPAVTVFFDDTNYYLVDGFYRYYSYRLEQIEKIEAEIQEGTLRDALLYSASINQQHGVRRSIRDKRRSVSICLMDEEWSQWSDHAIARHCGVSQPFVSKVRHELVSDNVITERPHRKRRDKHGNVNSINTRNIGRNRQRPQYTFHTTQVFDHMRRLIQSYEIAFPGLEVAYEKKHNTVTIRVTKGKKTAVQSAVESVQEPLETFLNQVINGDCLEILPTLPSNCIPLVITDVPIFDDYDLDEHSQDEGLYLDYLNWLREAFTELYRIGTSDARYCLNIQGTNGSSSFSYGDIVQLARQIGFQHRSEVIWYTPIFQRSALNHMGSVNAPNLTNPAERIALLYKHSWEKQQKGKSDNLGSDHMRLVQGLWKIDPDEQQDTSLHLARLPLEIPRNLLRLLSYQDDVVLDPFGSGGTVAVAAQQLGRPYISIESSEQHWEIAKERLDRVA